MNSPWLQRAACLDRYLASWRGDDGAVRGVVVTYWDQQQRPIEHVMHYYPQILAYLRLASCRQDALADPLGRAVALGERLLSRQRPDGEFDAAWGDIPPKGTAPVLQSAPAWALTQLFAATREARFLDAARRSLEYLRRVWWNGEVLSSTVVNQAAMSVAFLAALQEGDPTPAGRAELESTTRWILRQQHPTGAFYQGDHDLRFFNVYNAKILPGLLAAHAHLRWPELPAAIERLCAYLCDCAREELDGLFISHRAPVRPRHEDYLLRYRALKLVPGGRPWLLRRRSRIPFEEVTCPVWIARAGLIAYTLVSSLPALPAAARPRVEQTARRAVRALLKHQTPLGSFPNARGFSGDLNVTTWRDVAAPVRWNAYCLWLLAELAATEFASDEPVAPLREEPAITVPFTDDGAPMLWREDAGRIEITTADGAARATFSKKEPAR